MKALLSSSPQASGLFSRLAKAVARNDPLMLAALIILAVLLILGTIGPLLPLPPPDLIGAHTRLAPPGQGGLLGADNLGRDMFARICQGIQVTFLLSTSAVLVSAVAGALLGLVAAYSGGLLDEVITRAADVVFSFPAVLLGLLIAAIMGPGGLSAISAIVLVTFPPMLRTVRAAAVEVSRADFVTIAKLSGASLARRLFIHILPNVMVPIVIQTAYSISIGILVESALSFLGLGVQAPVASLGSILREGSGYITIAPWLVFGPGMFLVLAILSVNLVGEGLRHAVDPFHPRELGR